MKRFTLALLTFLLMFPTLLIKAETVHTEDCLILEQIQQEDNDSHLMPAGRHQPQVHARNLLTVEIKGAALTQPPAKVETDYSTPTDRYGLPADIQYRRIRPPISSTSQI